MSDVTPIKPDVVIDDERTRLLLEKINRRYAQFSSENGPPKAFALVLMADDGTITPFFQKLAGAPTGWRGFLALAGALLTERALKSD